MQLVFIVYIAKSKVLSEWHMYMRKHVYGGRDHARD